MKAQKWKKKYQHYLGVIDHGNQSLKFDSQTFIFFIITTVRAPS